jgi:hypothetical protein
MYLFEIDKKLFFYEKARCQNLVTEFLKITSRNGWYYSFLL